MGQIAVVAWRHENNTHGSFEQPACTGRLQRYAANARAGGAGLVGTQVQVWDSTAEIRYLVIPMQPEGTEGKSEAELADFVPRDAMIGCAL